MKEYGVLIVDDSAFMRKTISAMITTHPQLHVVGIARNGIDALEKMKLLKPDIITLDIEMPELDGLQTLKEIMKTNPIPVVMLSSGATSTLEAIELGAVDFVLKSELIKPDNQLQIEDFTKSLITVAHAKVPLPSIEVNNQKQKQRVETSKDLNKNVTITQMQYKKNLIVIGSSTGGPAALQRILSNFTEKFSIPIFIVQHMPVGFTKHLASRFNGMCKLKVKEAEHDEVLEAGTIYIAPAGIQSEININKQGQYYVKQTDKTNIQTLYHPSVDVTLLSIAEKAKKQLLAIILTGMGDDGLRGCKEVRKFEGTVISESEQTCVVYGMPKVVYEAGLANYQVPLSDVYDQLMIAIHK